MRSRVGLWLLPTPSLGFVGSRRGPEGFPPTEPRLLASKAPLSLEAGPRDPPRVAPRLFPQLCLPRPPFPPPLQGLLPPPARPFPPSRSPGPHRGCCHHWPCLRLLRCPPRQGPYPLRQLRPSLTLSSTPDTEFQSRVPLCLPIPRPRPLSPNCAFVGHPLRTSACPYSCPCDRIYRSSCPPDPTRRSAFGWPGASWAASAASGSARIFLHFPGR